MKELYILKGWAPAGVPTHERLRALEIEPMAYLLSGLPASLTEE
jgi:hypothetical protein